MSHSDTGETSRFKIKHIEHVQMLRVLPTAAITARILVTARMMIIRPCLLLQHKRLTNTKREKIKGRENRQQNFHHQIQGILPLQKNQLRKVILLKATDFKSYLNLRVINGNFLVKWQIMSITILSALFQKRR